MNFFTNTLATVESNRLCLFAFKQHPIVAGRDIGRPEKASPHLSLRSAKGH